MKYNLFALLILVLCVGCSGNVPLQGNVFDEDGNPITVGIVNFVSDQGLSRATIQPDGSYVVGTLSERDGLPPGTYRVYVTGAEIAVAATGPVRMDVMGRPMQQLPGFRQLVATQYTTEATTPLTVEIPAPRNRFDVIVGSP